MITNTGKNIVAKYLIGQTPAYASYIAIGCGAEPLDPADPFGDYSDKTSLEFETYRMPIISRGYAPEIERATITNVVGNGSVITYTAANNFNAGDTIDIAGTNIAGYNKTKATISSATSSQFTVLGTNTGTWTSGGIATKITSSIVVTAELPTEDRYEISEVGIYPAASDSVAGAADSKLIARFTSSETWTNSGSSIPTIDEALDSGNTTNTISTTQEVFRANSDNVALNSPERLNRQERPRFLNETIFTVGYFSELDGNNDPEDGSSYIQLSGAVVDLSENSPEDLIKVAFSVLNKNGESLDAPTRAKIVIDFVDSTSSSYARGKFMVGQGTSRTDVTFENRYIVASQSLGDLAYSSNAFNWKAVDQIKIYPVVNATDPSLFYIALDALRLDNLSSGNALYGLVGYTVIKNAVTILEGSYPRPIIKDPNTSNFVEFRFNVGVQ